MNLQKIIQQIPKDKKEHIVLGLFYEVLMVLALIGGGTLGYFLNKAILFMDISIGSAYLIILGGVTWKEVIHDWVRGKGNPEKWDFISNIIAPTCGILIYIFVRIIYNLL